MQSSFPRWFPPQVSRRHTLANRQGARRQALVVALVVVAALPWPSFAGDTGDSLSCGPVKTGAPCPSDGPATMWLGSGPALGVGNPVNVATGNKYQREVDLPALGGDLGLEVVRHYNSADRRDNGLGVGWTLSYDTRLYRMGHRIQILQADGSRVSFQVTPGADSCVAEHPSHGSLRIVDAVAGASVGSYADASEGVESLPRLTTANLRVSHSDDGIAEHRHLFNEPTSNRVAPGKNQLPSFDPSFYIWTWPNGRVLTFDQAGRLVSIQFASGERISIHRGRVPGRSDFRRVLRVTGSHNSGLNFEYDDEGVIAAHTALGTIRYVYTHGRRLRGVVWPWGVARVYLYEAAYQSGSAAAPGKGGAQHVVAGSQLTGIAVVDADGQVQRTNAWAYDDSRRVIVATRGDHDTQRGRIEFSYSAESSAGVARTVVRGANGEEKVFDVVTLGGFHRVARFQSKDCSDCPSTVSKARFDQHGQLTQAGTLKVVRDDAGRVATITDGDATTHIAWHKSSYLPVRIDRPSVVPGRRHIIELNWLPVDARHRHGAATTHLLAGIREQGWRPHWANTPKASISSPGQVPHGGDPSDGGRTARLSQRADLPPGMAQPVERHIQLHWQSDSAGVMRPYLHTRVGLIPHRHVEAAKHDAAWEGLSIVQDDLAHVLGWASTATGLERRGLDGWGRVAWRRFADGTVWRYAYADSVTTLGDDTDVLVGDSNEAEGRWVSLCRNERARRVARFVKPQGDQNRMGRLRSSKLVKPQWGKISVGRNVVINSGWPVGFNEADNKEGTNERVKDTSAAAVNAGRGHFNFNIRSITMSTPKGEWRRIVTDRIHDEALVIESKFEQQLRVYGRHGQLQYVWVCRPRTPGHMLSSQPEVLSYEEGFVHDELGRLVLHVLPEGGAVHYGWSDSGSLMHIVWQDVRGVLHPVIRAETSGYRYGNGVQAKGVTRDGWLVAMAHFFGNRPIWGQRLEYDDSGRVRAEVHVTENQTTQVAYAYDTSSRLVAARMHHGMPGGSEIPAGPHLWWWAWKRSGALRAHAVDGVTQPSSSIARNEAGLPQTIAERRLEYGPARRLAGVVANDHLLARYWHNAFGERIVRYAGGVYEQYLYVQQQRAAKWAAEQDESGIVQRYLYAGNVPVAVIEYQRPQPLVRPLERWAARALTDLVLGPGQVSTQAELYFVHADAIGLPRAVTDQDRRLRWAADFTPFGHALRIRGDLQFNLRYPGQWFDAATGWHDNYLRTYDPTHGHFLEPDPLGPTSVLHHMATLPGARFPATSPYGYAAQQPRRYADPSGLLLFAFDGTRQDFTTGGNVMRMALLYRDPALHGSSLPEAYYHAGPGEPGRASLDAMTAGSAETILDEQWQRLLNHLAALQTGGERISIDLLGYSRGAALARHFGNMLADNVRLNRFWHWDQTAGAVTACVDLRFMGLFDTVAQIGLLGRRNKHYDFTLAPEWTLAAHAVALHEHRALFPLVSLATTAEGGVPSNAVEHPFVGAHGDIGGGLLAETPDGSRPYALSDVVMEWMMTQAESVGVMFERGENLWSERGNPLLHDSRSRLERLAQHWNEQGESWAAGWLPVDRHVSGADGRRLFKRQADHPRYGNLVRAEVERFIERFEGWLGSSELAVGEVNLDAYEAWLRGLEADADAKPA